MAPRNAKIVTKPSKRVMERLAENIKATMKKIEALRSQKSPAPVPKALKDRVPQKCSNEPCQNWLNHTTNWRNIYGCDPFYFCQACYAYGYKSRELTPPPMPWLLRTAEAIAEGSRRKVVTAKKKGLIESSDEEEVDGEDQGVEEMEEEEYVEELMEKEVGSLVEEDGLIDEEEIMDCDEFMNDDEVVFENNAIQEAAYGRVFSDEEIDASEGPSLVSSRVENAYDKYEFHLDVVFRAHGSPKITWRAPNGEVMKLEHNRIELRLQDISHGLYHAGCIVSSVTEENEGSYTCLIADEFGDLEAEICAFRNGHRRSELDANIRVEQDHTPEAVDVAASSGDGRGSFAAESTTASEEGGPKVLENPTMILDSENKLMVNVEFQSRSEVVVFWISPQKRIMIGKLHNKSEDVFVAELQLETVYLEAGTYTCIISNDSRSVEARFEVQVAVLPEEPMKLVFDEPAFTFIPIVNEMQAVSEEPIKEEVIEIEGPESDTSVEPKSEYTTDFSNNDLGVHVDTSESHVEEIMEEDREVQNDGDENGNEAWSENDHDLLSPDVQTPEETLEQSVENSPVQEMEEAQEESTADWNIVVGDRRLANVGQTCYLNSTLQALAACPPFSRAVLEFLREVQWDFTRAAVVGAEVGVLQEILQTIVKLASPQMPTSLLKEVVPSGTDLRVSEDTLRRIRSSSIFKHFEENTQQDATESFSILRTFFEAMSGFVNFDLSKMMQTDVETVCWCRSCHNHMTPESIIDIRLKIDLQRRSSIGSLVDKWFRATMEVGRKCSSEECRKEEVWTANRVRTMPEVLVITLDRFAFCRQKKETIKVTTAVEVDENLDLSTYMDFQCAVPNFPSNQIGQASAAEYQLTAVIAHEGDSARGGHYVTYMRAESTSDDWIRCSDLVIESVRERRMSTSIQKDGYLFFYTKI